MKNFLRRKSTPNQAAVQKVEQDELKFSPSHPFLLSAEKLSGAKIFDDDSMASTFPKLVMWLKRHKEAINLVDVYRFSQAQDVKYHEFRQIALKSQINDGFELVIELEKSSAEKIDADQGLNEFPYIDFQHLFEAKKYWQVGRKNNFIMQMLKFEINKLVSQKIMENKKTAVHLVSLLAAIDAVPLNCIPLVNFAALRVPRKSIVNAIPRALSLERMTVEYGRLAQESVKKIEEVRTRYDELTPEAQVEAFKVILKQYINLFDIDTKLIGLSADCSFFYDFITHPKIITYNAYVNYVKNPNSSTYKELVEAVIQQFHVSPDDTSLVSCLCSLAFAHIMAPNISVNLSNENKDGNSNKEEMLRVAFDIYIVYDPLNSLKAISSNLNVEKSTEESVKYIIECLKLITNNWKELLQFIIDCSLQDYLSPKLRSIRYVINQAIV